MCDLMDAGELSCTVNVESLNAVNGAVTRRRTYKNVSIICCRDDFRDIILKILAKTSPLGKTYRLRDITIHKRFVQEGKATIKLVTQNIQLLLSNCPPSKLALFLKCLSSKLAHNKKSGFASERTRIRSDLPRLFENISPLSEKDLNVSKKRPFGDVNDNGLTPKRCKRGENLVAPRKKLDVLSSLQTNLTAEQLDIIKAVRSARNVFFTGSAGTGKTFLLRKLLGILPPEGTFITASTGAAACHIGGTTLHAFAGISQNVYISVNQILLIAVV
jgi:ATP-dependent DNA helicase PIF1